MKRFILLLGLLAPLIATAKAEAVINGKLNITGAVSFDPTSGQFSFIPGNSGSGLGSVNVSSTGDFAPLVGQNVELKNYNSKGNAFVDHFLTLSNGDYFNLSTIQSPYSFLNLPGFGSSASIRVGGQFYDPTDNSFAPSFGVFTAQFAGQTVQQVTVPGAVQNTTFAAGFVSPDDSGPTPTRISVPENDFLWGAFLFPLMAAFTKLKGVLEQRLFSLN